MQPRELRWITITAMLLPFLSLLLVPLTSALSNSQTSLTLFYQNNLNVTDDVNHLSFIVLDPLSAKDASTACTVVNEKLLSASAIRAHQSDVVSSLSYQAYAGRASTSQIYRIDNGVVQVNSARGLTFPTSTNSNEKLPVLCTQSNNGTQPGTSVATNQSQVVIAAAGNNIVGYRNKKSFRFLGIPYANPPKRFAYTTLYSPKGQTIQATAYGPQCAQSGGGSEDCLFLNIQTPYIPKAQTRNYLKPVMFWIHGGGFTGGTGADQASDGSDLASREDIVVVTINYRLSTLGFLAIPGTNITGNYGIADQITALEVSVMPTTLLMLDYANCAKVDGEEHCVIWRRSRQNHHYWGVRRCGFRSCSFGITTSDWEIPACRRHVKSWWGGWSWAN
jgi:phage tail protein X